jgi:hypothetical protein
VGDWPLKPDSPYSNAEDVGAADWWVYDDQGSGELERAGAKGSSNGFSSKAREDCFKRSSKPDMTAFSPKACNWPRQAYSYIFTRSLRSIVLHCPGANESPIRVDRVYDSSYSLRNE